MAVLEYSKLSRHEEGEEWKRGERQSGWIVISKKTNRAVMVGKNVHACAHDMKPARKAVQYYVQHTKPQRRVREENISALVARIKFNALSKEWIDNTRHFSLLARRYNHPAYKEILDLGPVVIPFILRELALRPDRWFSALSKLTKTNPAEGALGFDDAVARWIEWGKDNGYT